VFVIAVALVDVHRLRGVPTDGQHGSAGRDRAVEYVRSR